MNIEGEYLADAKDAKRRNPDENWIKLAARMPPATAGKMPAAITMRASEFSNRLSGGKRFGRNLQTRHIRHIEHLRAFVDPFHEAAEGCSRPKFDKAREPLRQQAAH